MRLLLAPMLVASSAVLAACGPGTAAKAVRPNEPTANVALGNTASCTTSAEPQLLTLDWEDTQRIDLERAMAKHVAVVHYDCTGFKVLRDCEVEGGYEYAGVSLAKTVAKLKDEDEVRANLPLGAAEIRGAVKRGATIDIVYVAVGQQSTTVHDVASAKLKGTCEGATHTVRAANVGAFALTTGTAGELNAAVGLLNRSASGASTSSKELSRVNGELEACGAASDSAKEPTPKCRALVQLLLSPVAGGANGKSADGSRVDGAVDNDRTSLRTVAIKNSCAEGFVLAKEGVCTRRDKAAAFMCDASSLDECTAQCAKGDGRSCYNAAANRLDRKLNAGSRSTDQEAAAFLEKSCAAGYAPGCGDLGSVLAWGRGVERSHEKAESLFTKACAMGDAVSCNFLASGFMNGMNGFKKDQPATRRYYERGCSLGSHEACHEASRMFVEGIGGPKDVAAATRLLERSCAGGNDDNCRRGQQIANTESSLAGEGEQVTLHEEQRNHVSHVEALTSPCKSTLRVDDKTMTCVKPDPAASYVCDVTSFEECKAQCDKGSGRSCWQAAANRLSHSNQNRSERGREEAFPWFDKGCKAGYPPACGALANAVMAGNGTAQNKERGRTLMEKACEMGDGPACTMLANNYAAGNDGFPKDPSRAIQLFSRACKGGDALACQQAERLAKKPSDPGTPSVKAAVTNAVRNRKK